jgi:hypothetical protein
MFSMLPNLMIPAELTLNRRAALFERLPDSRLSSATYQDVDPAEFANGLGHNSLQGRLIGHVADYFENLQETSGRPQSLRIVTCLASPCPLTIARSSLWSRPEPFHCVRLGSEKRPVLRRVRPLPPRCPSSRLQTTQMAKCITTARALQVW